MGKPERAKRDSRNAHQKIWEQAYGPIPYGYCVHHKNGDHGDNRLENLALMTIGEHTVLHWTGKRHSDGSKKKIEESKKGKPAWNKGIPMSSEAKAKLSAHLTGRPSPKKGKPGKPVSDETKQKIAEAAKGRPCPWARYPRSEEYRRKMSEATKGRTFSEEHRQHLSEAQKGIPKTVPPWNKGISTPGHPNVWKGKKLPLETRQRMSESQKRRYQQRQNPEQSTHSDPH